MKYPSQELRVKNMKPSYLFMVHASCPMRLIAKKPDSRELMNND